MVWTHDRRVMAVTISMMLGALGIPGRVCANESAIPHHPSLSDRFFIAAGALWSDSNVTANLNTGRIGLGTIVDF
jgi:hypothetical protein